MTLMEQHEDKFQKLAQERAARAAHNHEHPQGFRTDIACWGYEDVETGKRCDNLPEFHIEQLDGPCFFSCRPCAPKLMEHVPPIPLTGESRTH